MPGAKCIVKTRVNVRNEYTGSQVISQVKNGQENEECVGVMRGKFQLVTGPSHLSPDLIGQAEFGSC